MYQVEEFYYERILLSTSLFMRKTLLKMSLSGNKLFPTLGESALHRQHTGQQQSESSLLPKGEVSFDKKSSMKDSTTDTIKAHTRAPHRCLRPAVSLNVWPN